MELKKTLRKFLSQDFKIENKEGLLKYYDELISEEPENKEQFVNWLKKVNELESAVSEDFAWRYIRMTCNTLDDKFQNEYLDFVTNIQPHLAPYENKINVKINESPFNKELSNQDKAYELYFRQIGTSIKLFREKNIPIETQIQTLAQEYSSITGQQNVEWEGKEITLQQASAFVKSTDRNIREKAYRAIQEVRYSNHQKIDEIFSEMIKLRAQIAENAGFKSFTDYKFTELNRFDYNREDCYKFHNAIEKVVVPLNKKLTQKRKRKLGLDVLKPWDTTVDPDNNPKLHPFENGNDLLSKTIQGLRNIDPYFADCLSTMDKMKHLDLESRKGKSPGGYNYPLAESNVPFIFMNAASQQRDVETLYHESGHAIHSFLSKDLELNAFKNTPSEVAELASMSMELLGADQWNIFYENPEEHERAKREHLEGIISVLPWIATIDAFQHWIYDNPNHTSEERVEEWDKISSRFETGEVDYSGLEKYKNFAWQAQLHIFELPFYYIEYGFAQLGALGVWRNYKSNPQKALQDYKTALKAGYTRSIPEIYNLAGVKFDFSEEYIKELFSDFEDLVN